MAGLGLMRVLSAAAEERQRTIACNQESREQQLVQLAMDADTQLLRDEATQLLTTVTRATSPPPQLVRTSSAQALLGQCQAHLRAGRNRECIAIAESLCRRGGPAWAAAHALHGRALFRCRCWKAAAAQLRLALGAGGQGAERRQALLLLAAQAERHAAAAGRRRAAHHAAAQEHTAASLRSRYRATLLARVGAPPLCEEMEALDGSCCDGPASQLPPPPSRQQQQQQQRVQWARRGQAEQLERMRGALRAVEVLFPAAAAAAAAAAGGAGPSQRETTMRLDPALLGSPAAEVVEQCVGDAYILDLARHARAGTQQPGSKLERLEDFTSWEGVGESQRGQGRTLRLKKRLSLYLNHDGVASATDVACVCGFGWWVG
jgi:hypothetical protein